MDKKLVEESLAQIICKEGENLLLFKKIRQEGVKREIPLLFETIRAISCKRIEIKGNIVYVDGEVYREGVCLDEEVKRAITDHTCMSQTEIKRIS